MTSKGYNSNLSEEEHDLLKVIEECSEVQHVLCKIIKYGWEYVPTAHYPDKKGALLNEIGDLRNAIASVMKHVDRH